MVHKTIRGTIIYTSKKPECMDVERGREFFTVTRQADNVEVMHAHCEIDDKPNVIRDVAMAFNADASPLDCSVRITVGDQFEGTGWMRFTDTYAELESYNVRDGRISQKIDLEAPVRWLQSHPICGDSILMRRYDLSQGPGKQWMGDTYLTSPDHRGATGPMLFKAGFSIVYVGEEEVKVKAGTFKARHFQVTDTAGSLPEEHPPYDIWCTADDDYLFLKAGVGGYMQTYYELAEVTFE